MDELAQAMKAMPALEGELVRKMMADVRVVEVPAGTELLHEGAYVHELPILLEGLVRVFIGHEDKELLLYFIEPSDSCVMSIAAMTLSLRLDAFFFGGKGVVFQGILVHVQSRAKVQASEVELHRKSFLVQVEKGDIAVFGA